MLTNDEWLTELRTHIGTPFRHQGRATGIDGGMDCVGLPIVAAQNLGLAGNDVGIADYAHLPDSKQFYFWCREYLIQKPYTRTQPFQDQVAIGDIMTFWIDNPSAPRHIAVYTGNFRMIHSYAKGDRGVIEMDMDLAYWGPRLHGVWYIPTVREA